MANKAVNTGSKFSPATWAPKAPVQRNKGLESEVSSSILQMIREKRADAGSAI